MQNNKPYIKNEAMILEDIEINIDSDIKADIESFHFSKSDLEKIEVPGDLDKIIDEPFLETKKEKKDYIISWTVDLLLVFILILFVLGIVNPSIFYRVDSVYPVFVKIHNFLEEDNLKRLLGPSSGESGELKNKKPTVVVKASEVKKPRSNSQELDLIHSLANTLVLAEYKWECTEVTPKTINIVLEGVNYITDEYQRVYFRNNLAKWKNGDFSNAVEVHNRVWSLLDGNVGEAYELDNEAISKIKDNYFK